MGEPQKDEYRLPDLAILWQTDSVRCVLFRRPITPTLEIRIAVNSVLISVSFFDDDQAAAAYAIEQMHAYASAT